MRTPLRLAAIAVALAAPLALASCGGSDSGSAGTTAAARDDLRTFVTGIGQELNDFWGEGATDADGWTPARIKVPAQAAQTACGTIDADETGPAYCGDDHTMVLPVAFFRQKYINADDSGRNDAAVAAVVGHEFGHHLQTLGGLEEAIAQAQEQAPEQANLFSVANELNADCLMGIWIAQVQDEGRLEAGDEGEILAALEGIGDDKLSTEAGGAADAGTFDHGTSEQRQTWFEVGKQSGDPDACAKVFDDLVDGTLEQELQAGADAANAGTSTSG